MSIARTVTLLFAGLCLATCSGAGPTRGERSGAPLPLRDARRAVPALTRSGAPALAPSPVPSASIDAPPPQLAPPPATCRLGNATLPVAALLRHPERFAGTKVIVAGYVGAAQGACTQQVCPADEPCCNCGYAPVLLERPVERITGDTARLDLLWEPHLRPEGVAPAGWGCRADPASCVVACAPPTRRLVRFQARLEQEQGYYWLRVNEYCIEPG